MEPSVEFPDAELASSKKFGLEFRIPQQADEDSDSDPEPSHRFLRPQSAKNPELGVPTRISPAARARRPWTAHPKSKPPENSARKISKQTLRKPHLRPPPRVQRTPSECSDASSLVTAVGLENRKISGTVSPAKSPVDRNVSLNAVIQAHPESPTPETWATRVSTIPEKPAPSERALKKHPSFETWLEGSPHDSDEYDTDLDIEDFMKNLELGPEKRKKRQKSKKRGIEEEKPLDPTGKATYENQCQKDGIIPVSYMQRHLGDRTLRMRHHYLGGFGTRPLALALKNNTVTESVDLSDNFIEADGAVSVAAMLKANTFITSLNVSSNFIGYEGFRAFTKMLEYNTTLKSLTVAGNQLGDRCAHCLVEALKNNQSLTSLDLSNNDFGELGGIYIGGALGVNEGVVDLDISWNAIRNKGATAILNCLTKNRSLEVLDLSWNGCGLPGALALQKVLKVNTTLKVLDLTNNRLSTKAAETMALGLGKNLGLETLIMNMNPLKDAGVEAILKAAEKHPNLHFLSLEEIAVSRTNYNKIKELEASKDMVILHGGVGGYQRSTTSASLVRLFSHFLQRNRTEFEISCNQRDREKSGTLVVDDVKQALKQAGLRLTNKQVDIVLEEINYSNHSSINYRNILNGTTLADYYRRRPSRGVSKREGERNYPGLSGPMRRQLNPVKSVI